MSIRKYGRNAVATTVLAATTILGIGAAPQAFAEAAAPSIDDQLKVCAANTNVAVALDLSTDEAEFGVQREAVIKLINSLKEGNATAFSVITVDGDVVGTHTFNLPEQADEALKFVAASQATNSGKEAVWDKVLTAAHSIEGLDAVAVFSGARIDSAFDAPASVLRNAGVAVVPVSVAAAPSNTGVDTRPTEDVVAPAPTTAEEVVEDETTAKETSTDKTTEAKPTKDNKPSSETKAPSSTKSPEKSSTTSDAPVSEPTTNNTAPTNGNTAPTGGNTAPTGGNTAPTAGNTAPTGGNTAPTVSTPAPSNGGGGLLGGGLGGVIDTGKKIVGDIIGGGGGGNLIDTGKKIVGDIIGGGGGGNLIDTGRKLIGDFLGNGGLGNALGTIRNFLPISATTSALAGSTDPVVVLENAKATGLIDANGNWDAAAINTQLVEKGLSDENGVLNVEAVADALDAPQIVEADGTFNTEAVAELFSDKDLSVLFGAGETSSIGLVNASVTAPGVTEEEATQALPKALENTNVEAVLNSENGDEALKAVVGLGAVATDAEDRGIELTEAVDEIATTVEDTADVTVNEAADEQLPDATGYVYAPTAEEAYLAIGSAFGEACDTEIVEAPKTESAKEESRSVLASTGANVVALAGFGLLSALGAGFVIARRNK